MSASPYQRAPPDVVGEVRCRSRVLPSVHICPALRVAEQEAALEEVLVVGVDAAADVRRAAEPPAGADVDLLADEADRASGAADSSTRARFARSKYTGFPVRRESVPNSRTSVPISAGFERGSRVFPVLQVHVHERHAGRRVEGRQQAAAEVVRETQQRRVAGELVGGEEAAEQPDGDLEALDLEVAVEREALDDQTPRLVGLLRQAHEDQGVERVDRRHQQGLRVPVAAESG